MAYSYLALCTGTNLANLVHHSTYVSRQPTILPDKLIPLRRPQVFRVQSGGSQRHGFITSTLQFELASFAEKVALEQVLFGTAYLPSVSSIQVCLSAVDENGFYSPFTAYVDAARANVDTTLIFSPYLRLELPLINLQLQTVTKAGNATLTNAERLVLVNTASGNVTITLPLASTVNPKTIVSVQKIASANTVTIQRNSTNTINGSSASLTLTAINSRYDLASDGVGAWVTVATG